MKTRHSSGLTLTIPFALPTYWTPEQALAVFELLDDLRCPIFGRYQIWLFDEFHQGRHPDVDLFAATVRLQDRSGGNLTGLLKMNAHTVRDSGILDAGASPRRVPIARRPP